MDFGLHVGTRRVGATPEGLEAIAIRAEELGFSYIGFPDHVIIPHKVDSKYPYNKEGKDKNQSKSLYPFIKTSYRLSHYRQAY